MPTYQYSCTSCGTALEVQQSFSDEPLTVCPECQGRLRKVFSAVGVVFKGSGFYRTDSRPTPSSDGDSGSSTSTGSSDSGKSDSGKTDSGKTSDSGKSGSSQGGSTTTSKETAKAGSSA